MKDTRPGRHQLESRFYEVLEKAKSWWLKADQGLPGPDAEKEGTVVGGVMDLFYIFIVVVFTQLHTLVKIVLTGSSW